MAYTTIDDPSAYFQTALWSGNDSTQSIVNDGNSDMQPDWVWIKRRTGTAINHLLYDSTRGATKNLTITTSDEGTRADGLTAFDSDGFTLGAGGGENSSGNTFVGWQWQANGGTRTTFTESGSNPGGGRQVNTTAGFSLIDYTGTGSNGTIAHGLGATPNLVIIKNRDGGNSDSWFTHWTDLLASDAHILYMNNNDAETSNATAFNSTAPTSTNITVGTNSGTNKDGDNYICYAFKNIQGYSKIGTYTGNGSSTNGTFVYTGFKPAFILWKQYNTSGSNWGLRDIERGPFNPTNDKLMADSTAAETEDWSLDLLSNGFKWYDGGGATNQGSATYVYWAIAHQPFVSSEGVPTTAQ